VLQVFDAPEGPAATAAAGDALRAEAARAGELDHEVQYGIPSLRREGFGSSAGVLVHDPARSSCNVVQGVMSGRRAGIASVRRGC
jgi:hypothetical protein